MLIGRVGLQVRSRTASRYSRLTRLWKRLVSATVARQLSHHNEQPATETCFNTVLGGESVMPYYSKSRLVIACSILFLFLSFVPLSAQTAHTWEMQEIVLHAAKPYANAYKDVDTWVELKGPTFSKRVYGF